MLSVKEFLKDVKLTEDTKEYLNETWSEIEKYILRLKEYNDKHVQLFLREYLIEDVIDSSRMENSLYSFDIISYYNAGVFDSFSDPEQVLKSVNKMVRKNDKIIAREKYYNTYNGLKYDEYLELEKWNLSGNYRKNVVWIGDSNNIQKAIHVPPKPEEIPEYMKDLLDSLNNPQYEVSDELKDPIIKAALLHMIFIKIHPFGNGNGRTARILLNCCLRKGINLRFDTKFLYPPINLSPSFQFSKYSYNEYQNNIIFRPDYDNNVAINKWILYNLNSIKEQLYYLNQKLDKYNSFFSKLKIK